VKVPPLTPWLFTFTPAPILCETEPAAPIALIFKLGLAVTIAAPLRESVMSKVSGTIAVRVVPAVVVAVAYGVPEEPITFGELGSADHPSVWALGGVGSKFGQEQVGVEALTTQSTVVKALGSFGLIWQVFGIPETVSTVHVQGVEGLFSPLTAYMPAAEQE
jgi:hypothetical protein